MTLERYEVKLRGRDGHTWSMMFSADNFAHAEEQAVDALPANDASIITSIELDWDEEVSWEPK